MCSNIHKTWGHGIIECGEVNEQTSMYIAGYMTKKMTRSDDVRLEGRHPEFARMSRQNGGIGAGMMDEVASTLLTYGLEEREDVPHALRSEGHQKPLGRYLVRRLRERVGKEPNAPAGTYQTMAEELQALRMYAFDHSISFKEHVVKENAQAALNQESRMKYKRKREL